MKKSNLVLFLILFCFTVIYAQDHNHPIYDLITTEELENLPEELKNQLQQLVIEDNVKVNKSATKKPEWDDNRLKSNVKISPSIEHIKKTTSLIKSLNRQNNSYYKEKLDSMVAYEPKVTPTYDSIATAVEEYKTDENGFVIEEISQTLNESTDEWEYDYKVTYSNNADGKPVEAIDYEWDGETWQPAEKYNYEYDSFGNAVLITVNNYNVSDETYYLALKLERLYDSNNRILSYKYYDIAKYGQNVISYKYSYTYNANGDILTYSFANNWNVDLNTWTVQQKIKREYDNNEKMIAQVYSRYNASLSKWETFLKYEYEYLNDGSVLESNYRFNSQTSELYLAYQRQYKIDREYENNFLVEEIRQDFNGDRWTNIWKREYKYDQWGNEIFNGFYKTYISEDQWELMDVTERSYNQQGQLLYSSREQYVWDTDTYSKTGELKEKRRYNEEGLQLSNGKYKWDTENQEWVTDYRIHTSFSDNGYSFDKYIYEQNGTKITSTERRGAIIYEYDHSIGRYTAINDGGYYKQHISYNDNLKVKEIIKGEVHAQDDKKTVVHYDKLQRDTAWYHYRYDYDLGEWQYSWKQLFSYYNLTDGNLKVTERWKDYPGDYGFNYYYHEEKLLATVWIGFNDDSTRDSTSYIYNDKGQIVQRFTKDGNYNYKFNYKLVDDTLTITNYRKYGENAAWELEGKDIFKIDTAISKNQIQLFPGSFGDDFHLFFDYGKIEYYEYYEYYSEDEQQPSGIEKWHYSPASVLSGDAIINGYIYEAPGSEKSISVTQETGDPISGVTVSLLNLADNFMLATDTTDAEGYYEFKGVPNGNFYLKVEMEGYQQSSTYEIDVTPDSTMFENKDFKVSDGELATGLNEIMSDIKIYPNPASDYITIQSPALINSLKITDVSGAVRLIYKNLSQNLVSVPVNGLSLGVYFIQATTDNTIYQSKFIIE